MSHLQELYASCVGLQGSISGLIAKYAGQKGTFSSSLSYGFNLILVHARASSYSCQVPSCLSTIPTFRLQPTWSRSLTSSTKLLISTNRCERLLSSRPTKVRVSFVVRCLVCKTRLLLEIDTFALFQVMSIRLASMQRLRFTPPRCSSRVRRLTSIKLKAQAIIFTFNHLPLRLAMDMLRPYPISNSLISLNISNLKEELPWTRLGRLITLNKLLRRRAGHPMPCQVSSQPTRLRAGRVLRKYSCLWVPKLVS